MKHRKTMGHCADAAESAALTVADPRATERIIEALDYEEEADISLSKNLSLSDVQCRLAAVQRVRRALGDKCANVIHAYLNSKNWEDMNIPRSSFLYALKKVENYFHPDNSRVK